MIGFVEGKILYKELDRACLVVVGTGYVVQMPVPDLARLGDVDETGRAFVHTHVREGAIELFGFESRERRQVFERLISISGVGPKLALSVLSSLELDEMVQAVSGGDEARLCKVPGIGRKTAARIVLELRDRFAKEGLVSSDAAAGLSASGGVEDDLRSALANLGYKPAQIDRAVKAVTSEKADGEDLSALVLRALRHV